METSDASGPTQNRGLPRSLVGLGVALAIVAFGLLTELAPGPQDDAESITPSALSEPKTEPGFHVVADLSSGPWDPYRIRGGYLWMDAEPTVVTDDDRLVAVHLPDLEILFGAIDAESESVAYGRTSLGPAIWRSPDTVTWTLEQLPWSGTVRAAAVIDDRLVLIGIATESATFTYVLATQTNDGWVVRETTDIPDTGLISVPGGFAGRGTATDGTGYGYLYSENGLDWSFQSARAAAASRSAGQVPVFVVESEDGPLLRVPGEDEPFDPPDWPVSGVWIEGETTWVQTPNAAWSTNDGIEWVEYPIGVGTGVRGGFSVLLPVGDTARLATAFDGRISLMRWDPGSVREG